MTKRQHGRFRATTISRKANSPSKKSKLRRLPSYIKWVLPGVVIPVVILYFTLSGPDIRFVCGSPMVLELLDRKDDVDGSTQLHFHIIDTFKNFSVRSGHIERFEFTPIGINVRPEIEVTHVDKEDFGWREQRKIEVRFDVHLTKEMNEVMDREGKQMRITMKAVDNTGKSLKVCDSEGGYYRTLTLSAERK